MKTLSAIHRWCGALIGVLLALLGLSGAVLVWEGEWINLPGANDPVLADVTKMGGIAQAAAIRGELSRITFASRELALHEVIYADGSGAYVRQDGTIVDSWESQWDRPEQWLFDFHHHLFAGDIGETITGMAGLAGVLFTVTGLTLWWRSRRSFAPRIWPRRFAPGPIVSHHRDLGAVTAPLLIISMITGAMMLFQPLRVALLGAENRPAFSVYAAPNQNLATAIATAAALFPTAELRRITPPVNPGGMIAVRLRQSFEWTPNGRTFVRIAAQGGAEVEDPVAANGSATLVERLYPIHSGKAGGLIWKLGLTASGLALALLGSLAMWSFWARRMARLKARYQSIAERQGRV